MESRSRDLVIARLLTLLEGDWVPACALASFVYHSGVTSPPENRDVCLSLVREALVNGWIRVGELKPGFEAWDVPVSTVMGKLAGDWPRDTVPGLDGPSWFDVTSTGRARGAELSRTFGAELNHRAGSYVRVAVEKP